MMRTLDKIMDRKLARLSNEEWAEAISLWMELRPILAGDKNEV